MTIRIWVKPLVWLMENEEPAEYYKDKEMYKDFRGIHAGWIKEILMQQKM